MWEDFLALIFPEYCRACRGFLERGEQYICTDCRYNLPRANSLAYGGELSQKFWGRANIHYALGYLKFSKGGRVQRLLHELKYEGQEEIGEVLGRWYGFELSESGLSDKFDLILPVPLHPSKRQKRGYNQSDGFAKGLSEGLQVPWSEAVIQRVVPTQTQTKKKRMDRWYNVAEIFVVEDEPSVKDKRILLVDDVITTGATLEACANVLFNHGCQTVSIAVIAVAT